MRECVSSRERASGGSVIRRTERENVSSRGCVAPWVSFDYS